MTIPHECRDGYSEGAAPEAIRAHINDARAARNRAEAELVWLLKLYETRVRQIEKGEWPQKKEGSSEQ